MFKIFRKEFEWGGKKLLIETGKVARQADGSVMVRYGGTTVLCTAVGAKQANPDADFFPLTCDYQEKYFAAGKIPGGFFKREGKPTEREVLISRLIDRPIRPLFPKSFFNSVQVTATVIEYDGENDSDIPAMIGASAALTLSGMPFLGPIGAARVGYINGEFVLNPTLSELKTSELDLVVAGTAEGVMMVESEAKQLSEEIMLNAVKFGHEQMQAVIKAIIQLAEHCAKDAWPVVNQDDAQAKLKADMKKQAQARIEAAYATADKQQRRAALDQVMADMLAAFTADGAHTIATVQGVFKNLEQDLVRGQLLKSKQRIDGRGLTDIRPIAAEVSWLPRVHGSALFTRGETQALVVATLGTKDDEQLIDALDGERKENFMLHYNFPPYSVGEVGRLGSPGRREVGHGKLAWRAIHPMLPSVEQFPYTVRVVSEITESNGSSSMATVCGTSLALMDAGVPLPAPVAGIAMGLVKEDAQFAVLSDILGDEDHLGDMDFKVAGTAEGITALQMDIKITSITYDIMQQALAQAKDGRMHILGEMAKALDTSRGSVSANAPRVESMQIQKDKIREVIGSGGSVIKKIVEESGAKVDIQDDGTVKIYASSDESLNKARTMISNIVAVAEVGKIYTGKVVRVTEFGAFVNFLGAQDGLVHVSEMADYRVERVTDIVNEGDTVTVKCVGIDDRGRVRLSMKAVNAPEGSDDNNGGGEREPAPRKRRARPSADSESGDGESSSEGQAEASESSGEEGERRPQRRSFRRDDRGDRGDRGDRSDRGGFRPRSRFGDDRGGSRGGEGRSFGGGGRFGDDRGDRGDRNDRGDRGGFRPRGRFGDDRGGSRSGGEGRFGGGGRGRSSGGPRRSFRDSE